MSFRILGAGSIGCLFGYHLRKAGYPVSLIFRRQAALDQFIKAGKSIRILKEGKLSEVNGFNAELSSDLGSPYENVLVATKAYQALNAIKEVQDNIGPNTTLILIQNGMGVLEEVIGFFLSKSFLPKFIIGTTTHGCYRNENEPFIIKHTAFGQTHLSLLDSKFNLNLTNNQSKEGFLTAKKLGNLPLSVDSTLDSLAINEKLLTKLAINACINPLASLGKYHNGKLAYDQLALSMVKQLTTEIASVYAKLDPPLLNNNLTHPHLLYQLIMNTIEVVKQNRCSMLQDIEASRKTEIEYISGYISLLAKRHNVSCPTNDSLVQMIKATEAFSTS